jgi:hypothetical protein
MNDTSTQTTTNIANGSSAQLDQALASIRQALNGLRYGVVSVIVQDGVVVQIERTERSRLTRNDRGV